MSPGKNLSIERFWPSGSGDADTLNHMRHPQESRVRVLQVSGALYFGGAEKVIAALAHEVDRTRFEMEVCCTHVLGPLADAIAADGVPVTLAKNTRRSSYLRPLDVREVIARFKPHVVHTHGLPALSNIGPLAMLGYVPFWVHTFHYGNYPYAQRRYMWMERVYGRWADRLVAVAEPQRQALIRHHGYSPDRIVTLLNGVPANPFANGPGRPRAGSAASWACRRRTLSSAPLRCSPNRRASSTCSRRPGRSGRAFRGPRSWWWAMAP